MKITLNSDIQSSDNLSIINGQHNDSEPVGIKVAAIDESLLLHQTVDILLAGNTDTKCEVELTGTCLQYRYRDNRLKDKCKIIYVVDIIGCSVSDATDESKVVLNIIAYRIRRGRRKRKSVKLVFSGYGSRDHNYEEAIKWKRTIMSLNYGPYGITGHGRHKPLMFIVNPKSGRGRALKIFEDFVKPLLKESETLYELQITDHANHALELMRDTDDLTRYRAVVVVSGDGLLYEVVNGLTKRMDTITEERLPVTLGIIPGGSGNGLAHSVNQAFLNHQKAVDSIYDCVLHVLQGHPLPMDLVRVTTEQNVYFSFLSLGWGLMADIDIESERLRALGEPRFTIYALYRSFALRKNRARLSYLPTQTDSSDVPVLAEPVGKDWVTIDDQFIQIYASYQSHINSTAIFAPEATLDDGIIWLLFLRSKVSRRQVIQFLLALEKGRHPALPYVDFVPVRAFRIEPYNNIGKMTVDGELVESGPIQAEVVPRMATILTR
ncbi:sphingosine kinase 2-like [Oppia nitens]|uniref:sphingosine kinase 2-like n=1 Tax=Oppia nitens TaxID=1686743 RepID=UPI0023DC3F4B|nr:sphingosine kinase 2-like [Oppia nitens]